MNQNFIPLHGWIIISHTDHQFVYPFNHWWIFELFPVWGYYEQCCNAQVCKNLVYKFLCRHMSSTLLGIYLEVELPSHMLTYNLLSNCQTVFQSDCTILHSDQQCMRVLFLHILANVYYFPLSFFLIVILVGVKWYFIVVLVCSSLMTNEDD